MSVLTVGETMALLDPIEDGSLRLGSPLTLRVAGAESNVAVGLARLGVAVTWVSRLGDDPFGHVVRDALASEGVDLRYVRVDPEAPTGVFFKVRSESRSSVFYYRRGSAAARLRPEDVPDAALAGVELVHLTGITMALGKSPRTLVLDVAERARKRGITVVFDPNYRSALWASASQAASAQAAVLPFVDWYLCGLEEGALLHGTGSAAELYETVRADGVGDAVVRVGARGALIRTDTGLHEVPPVRIARVLDEVGAGDAFAAGFVYGLLQHWPTAACARAGNLIAGAALTGTGDWERLPRLAEIEQELRPRGPAAPSEDETAQARRSEPH